MGKNDPETGPKSGCFDCRHFFITHEPVRPYGCRAMGFKSREFPCTVVLQSSGEPCLCREPRAATPERERR